MNRSIPLAAACAALLALSACQDGPVLADAATAVLPPAPGPRLGVVVDGSGFRWPGGTVPYRIESGFTSAQQQVILDAMSLVQSSVAGVSFKQRTTETVYMSFRPDPQWCLSNIGRLGGDGSGAVELTPACASHRGRVTHEILHTLGMDDEQNRCDRDAYVTVDRSRALSAYSWIYNKNCGGTDLFEYDEGSIMHLGSYEYTANGQPPITSRRGLAHLMGQRDSLSRTDVRTLNYIYKPYPPQGYRLVTTGGQTAASWNPSGGATHYTLRHIERYEYHDNYVGNSWTQEQTIGTATLSGTSMSFGSYTSGTCVTYDDGYTTELYVYEIELQAHFPDGVVGSVGRYPAVGPC